MRAVRVLCILLCAAASTAAAGTLELSNGAVIPGEFVGIERERVVWQAELIGEIKVDAAEIVRLDGRAPPDLRIGKTALPKGCPVSAHGHTWTFQCDPQAPVAGEWVDLGRVDRDREGSGRITVAATLERGNTSTNEYEADARASWRRGRLRHVVDASVDYEQKRGNTTDDEASLDYQLDRLFKNGWYVYTRAEYDRDRFATVQESMIGGVGPGRIWTVGRATRLKLQGGPDWGWFDLQGYGRFRETGGNVSWRVDHDLQLWKLDLTLFHEGEFSWLLRDSDLNRIDTQTGMELPLLYGIIAEIRVDYERTGVSLPEVDNTDVEWVFSLGYKW
jgi:hypothetical protein